MGYVKRVSARRNESVTGTVLDELHRLEDATLLPDGRRPAGNGELLSVAAQMLGA